MATDYIVRRRELALEFDTLADEYLARQDWANLQAMEREWLEAYGSITEMMRVLDDYATS